MASFSTGAAGVPASNKNPAVFLEVVFDAGVASAGGNVREVLLLGNKTSAGNAVVDTDIKTPTSETEAINFWGIGSELHLAYAGAAKKSPGAKISGIAVTEATGVQASGTITVTGAATGSGTYSVFIHGEQIDVAVLSGDSANTIAANIASKINGAGSRLACVATVATNVVTVRYRHVGTRGNLIKLRQSAEATITGSTFALSGASLASGTGTDSLTAALTTASASTFKYYVPANVDLANLQLVQTQLTTMAGPLQGKRQYFVSANVGTLSSATTIAQTLNENRGQIVWHLNGEDLPIVVAAVVAAYRSVAESQSLSAPLLNIDFFPYIKAPASKSLYVSSTQTAAALDVGLTPIAIQDATGHATLLRSITCHSQDALGNPDTRSLDTVKVVVPDGFADQLAVAVPSGFPNLRLRDDEQSGDDPLPAGVTTPSTVKSFCYGIAKEFESRGDLQGVDNDFASWAFNLASNSPGRVNATMPVTPVSWFVQFSGQVRQVG